MKRLIRKASNIEVYHGTTIKRLKEITRAGALLPQESVGAGNFNLNGNFDGFVFLATTFDKALGYAGLGFIDDGGIEDTIAAVVKLSVPEEMLLPDDNDCSGCETWQESADNIQQIKVSGQVLDSYFSEVYIGSNGRLQYGYSGWEESYKQYMQK